MPSLSQMMICAPCRIQILAAALHRARVPRPLSSQIGASVRSASSTAPTPTETQNSYGDDGIPPSFEGLDIDVDEPWRIGDKAPNAHSTTPTEHQRKPIRFTRQEVPVRKESKITNREASLKLFEKVVKHQSARNRKAEASAQPRDLSPESVEFYGNLAKLRPMMLEKPMDECLDFFLTTLWDKAPSQGRSGLLKKRGAYLLNKVAEAKIKDFDNEKLPSIAQITRYFYDMDSLGSQRWSAMMMGLIKSIVAKSPSQAAYPGDSEYMAAMARKEELRNDLVDSWIVFHRYKMSPDNYKLQTSDEAEFRLTEISVEELQHYGWRKNYKGALGCIFPNWKQPLTHIPAVAIATFVLLVDPAHSESGIRRRAKPLLAPIGRVVRACPLPQEALKEMLGPYPTVYLYVLGKWNLLIERLCGKKKPEAEQTDDKEETSTREPKGYTKEGITYALGMGDLKALESAWEEFWYDGKVARDPKYLREHGTIFDQFIKAFTALKRPNRAIDIWDNMTNIVKIPPTLATWAAMIDGCRGAKNAAALEKVWKKLMAWARQVDQAVDDKLWASRIMGLMECGEPQVGLRALVEMAKLSKDGGTKVNINVINAAVAGLLRADAEDAAHKVLTWAAELYDGEDKIEPNVVTYNTLLGRMVSRSTSTQIKATLGIMAANAVKPDAATYTILLEGLINEDLDSVQQALAVHELLSDMEKQGIIAEYETLARMLHLVLRQGKHTHDHTKGAAGAILDYMNKHGQRLTPHMYAILIDHHFARSPPGLAEVEKLLKEFPVSDGNDGGRVREGKHRFDRVREGKHRFDRVFYEHLIRGFAQADQEPGALDRAFEEFEKLNNVSSKITLDTLEVLLRSLVKNGRNSMAQRVVDHIKAHRGASAVDRVIVTDPKWMTPLRSGWKRYWDAGFWMYAMEQGLLSAEEWRGLKAADIMNVAGAMNVEGDTPQAVHIEP